MAGAPPFDLSALSSVLNDPSIRGMAEQIANNPAFAQMTSALQESLLGGGGGAAADPARYADAMSSVLGNPEFMAMAERLGQQIMAQDPGMASLMASMQSQASAAEVERRLEGLKADPDLAPIMKEIEEGGPAAMMKYWDDPATLEKLSKAMGSAFGPGALGGGAGAGAAAAKEEEGGGEDDAADEAFEDTVHAHASNGDVDALKALLDGKPADEVKAMVNARDEEDRVPLHFSSGYGEQAVVDVLIASGADVDAADANGNTPLHYAAGYGQPAIVKALLAAGAKASVENADGKSPPVVAALNGADDVVDLFGPEAAAAARAAAAEVTAAEEKEEGGDVKAEEEEGKAEEAAATE